MVRGRDYDLRDADGKLLPTLTARLWDDNTTEHWPEELTRTTGNDAQNAPEQLGKVALTVKSSDVISQPTLEAHWTDAQGEDVLVGSVGCDFAEADAKRRFPNNFDPDDTDDTGWLFDFPQLSGPNNTTPAKVYLKFRKAPDLGDTRLGNLDFPYAPGRPNPPHQGDGSFRFYWRSDAQRYRAEVVDINLKRGRTVKGLKRPIRRAH